MTSEELNVKVTDLDTQAKVEALAKHLEVSPETITANEYNYYESSEAPGGYIVLTDEEAQEAVSENIKEFVWAFTPSFLASQSKVADESVFEAIRANEKCEDNNEAIIRLIDDFGFFVKEAVLSDGRGHFLSQYDGEEIEQDGLYIYRTN